MSQLHPDEVAMVLDTVQQAVKDKARYTTEHRVVWPDGTVRWLQGKGQVAFTDSGEVTGTMGCVADITERVEAALAHGAPAGARTRRRGTRIGERPAPCVSGADQ